MKEDIKTTPASNTEPRFKTVLDALDYLKAAGWKVEKSKLYADQHIIGREKDGTFSQKALDKYAKTYLQKLDGSDADAAGLAQIKLQLEIDILEEKKKEEIRENEIADGKWVLKSEVEQKHTGKLALFLIAIDNFINSGELEAAIDIVRGDREKAADFKNFIKKEFRAALSEYAKQPVFTVPQKTIKEAETLKTDANTN